MHFSCSRNCLSFVKSFLQSHQLSFIFFLSTITKKKLPWCSQKPSHKVDEVSLSAGLCKLAFAAIVSSLFYQLHHMDLYHVRLQKSATQLVFQNLWHGGPNWWNFYSVCIEQMLRAHLFNRKRKFFCQKFDEAFLKEMESYSVMLHAVRYDYITEMA